MLTLGVETSCDETAVAIVRDGREVVSSVVASQASRHAPFGGVVPEIAAREHVLALVPVFERALEGDILALGDLHLSSPWKVDLNRDHRIWAGARQGPACPQFLA